MRSLHRPGGLWRKPRHCPLGTVCRRDTPAAAQTGACSSSAQQSHGETEEIVPVRFLKGGICGLGDHRCSTFFILLGKGAACDLCLSPATILEPPGKSEMAWNDEEAHSSLSLWSL